MALPLVTPAPLAGGAVEMVEVAPRDGLQSDAAILPTATKVGLVERLVAAGARRIELTSFVNPAKVPAMADADELCAAIPRPPGVSYIGLVLNARGLERAVAGGVDEINVVIVASDTFGRRNQGATTEEATRVAATVVDGARRAGLAATVTIAAAFGCPFEGEVPVDRVVAVATAAAEAGATRVCLADTIGVADPGDVALRFAAVAAAAGPVQLAAHFHNTRNTGYANAYAALTQGVKRFDASLGGVGGCPFAPAATGNVATEDLAYLFGRMGLDHGLDLPALVEANTWLAEALGHPLPGLYAKAGPFPPATAPTP